MFSLQPTPPAMFPISGNDNSILLVPQTRNFSHCCPTCIPPGNPSESTFKTYLDSNHSLLSATTMVSVTILSQELVQQPLGFHLCLLPIFNTCLGDQIISPLLKAPQCSITFRVKTQSPYQAYRILQSLPYSQRDF